MNKKGQLLLEYPRRDRIISFLIALGIHLSALAIGGFLFVKPVQFGVEAGISGIEVNLVAAPQEPLREIPREEVKIFEQLPEETIPLPTEEPVKEEKLVEKQLEQKAPTNIGKDTITMSSAGGALTEAHPNYLKNPAPVYLMEARSLGQEGLVVLSVDVDRQGNPSQVKIKQSAGYLLLDNAAMKAVRRWKFSPAQIGKLSIESNVEVPIRFRLEKNN